MNRIPIVSRIPANGIMEPAGGAVILNSVPSALKTFLNVVPSELAWSVMSAAVHVAGNSTPTSIRPATSMPPPGVPCVPVVCDESEAASAITVSFLTTCCMVGFSHKPNTGARSVLALDLRAVWCYPSGDMAKNPAAVALGRLGGRATASRLTSAERRAKAQLAGFAAARVAELEPEVWRAKSRKGGLARAKAHPATKIKFLPTQR